MTELCIIEFSSLDLGKEASAQLRDYFDDVETLELQDFLDIPSRIQEKLEDSKGVIVIADTTDEAFDSEVIEKVLEVELGSDKPVQKLFLAREKESTENFQKRAAEKTREHAEKLANKIKNSPGKSRYEQI